MPIIRPAQVADAAAMARVHVDTWRTSYAGIVFDEHLAGLSYRRCEAGWIQYLFAPTGETLAFVAEADAGHIVAIASGGPLQDPMTGFDGELYVLYVLKSYQRMGFGGLLLAQVARGLAGRAYHSLVAWVLKDNPACRFYERLGGRPVGEKAVEIGGRLLVDVAYAWSDLAALGQWPLQSERYRVE